jgi:hypothetical protein
MRGPRRAGVQANGGFVMRRSVQSLLAAAAVLVFAAGCGSSSSKTASTSSAPLTESAFVAQVSTVRCPVGFEVKAILAIQTAASLEKAATVYEALNAKLATIIPPGGRRAAYAQYRSLLIEEAAKLRALAKAASERHGPQEKALISEINAVESHASALASEAGLAQCPGTSSTTSTG